MQARNDLGPTHGWARARGSLRAGVCFLAVIAGTGLATGQSTGAIHGDVIGAPFDASTSTTAKPAATNAVIDVAAKSANSDSAGFDKLSGFPFKVSDDMVIGAGDALANSRGITEQIPESVKVLNEKEVSVTGFMLPTKVDAGKATEFLLLKNQSLCCYGMTPNLNEYVAVRLTGKGVPPVMDRLVTVTGKLHVGEMRQSRMLVGIYEMEGDKVAVQTP